MPDPSPSTLTV